MNFKSISSHFIGKLNVLFYFKIMIFMDICFQWKCKFSKYDRNLCLVKYEVKSSMK